MWPIKNVEKLFMAHQYLTKIFHDPHKNPLPLPPPTYLVYGPLSQQIKSFLFKPMSHLKQGLVITTI